MGSSGGSTFSDYSEKDPSASNANSGGASKVDKCGMAFAVSLEEVSRCDYYKTHHSLPPIGTDVLLVFNRIRLAICETSSGNEIGYLPTKFNYLKNCLDNGFAYSGTVRSIILKPIPTVLVDMVPS
jgi:hypothetical protein